MTEKTETAVAEPSFWLKPEDTTHYTQPFNWGVPEYYFVNRETAVKHFPYLKGIDFKITKYEGFRNVTGLILWVSPKDMELVEKRLRQKHIMRDIKSFLWEMLYQAIMPLIFSIAISIIAVNILGLLVTTGTITASAFLPYSLIVWLVVFVGLFAHALVQRNKKL